MLNNPDLIASLIGFDGFLALALTAAITRLLADSDRAAKLESARDRVQDKVADVAKAVEYAQGRIDGLIDILSDGRVTPAEMAQVRDEATVIKDKIASIVNGGDAE